MFQPRNNGIKGELVDLYFAFSYLLLHLGYSSKESMLRDALDKPITWGQILYTFVIAYSVFIVLRVYYIFTKKTKVPAVRYEESEDESSEDEEEEDDVVDEEETEEVVQENSDDNNEEDIEDTSESECSCVTHKLISMVKQNE